MKYIMQENGFCQGVELKREPTWEETSYCLSEILGFDLDYAFELDKPDEEFAEPDEMEDYLDEVKKEKEDIQKYFIDFIQGKCEWHSLCDVVYCYDDIDDFTIGIFAYLLKYLEDNGII